MATPTFADIDLSELAYSSLRTNVSTGAKNCYVSTRKGSNDRTDNLRFQLSRDHKNGLSRAIFGVENPMQGGDEYRRGMNLTIEDPELAAFLQALDEKNIQFAIDHSEELFGKVLGREAIEEKYTRLYKESPKPGELAALVKVKLVLADPARPKQDPTQVYQVVKDVDPCAEYPSGHLEMNPCDYTVVEKQAKCLAVVKTSGIWKTAAGFGMSLILTHLAVWPTSMKLGVEAFSCGGVKVADSHRAPYCGLDDDAMEAMMEDPQ